MQSIVTISIVLDFFLRTSSLSLSFEINIEYDVPLTDVKLFPHFLFNGGISFFYEIVIIFLPLRVVSFFCWQYTSIDSFRIE